jgi:predicted Fe-Mo cluster-binding NifX family protein
LYKKQVLERLLHFFDQERLMTGHRRKCFMKIAVPFSQQLDLYRDNPSTAPKFGIYEIILSKNRVAISLVSVEMNPWCKGSCDAFDDAAANCACDEHRRNDIRHITEHYALLEVLGGCSYLLADHFCDNTKRVLNNGGISVFKYPSVIRSAENAIKNFIIGASLANTVEHVHYAS